MENQQKRLKHDTALRYLNILAGEWKMEITVPTHPPTIVRDLWTCFEWMEGYLFFIWRWGPERSDFPGGLFPSALSIIGYDDTTAMYSMHYFDSRGVHRILDMTVIDGVWKIWREGADFSQRFIGKFSEDGNIITGKWEKSMDDSHWEHDFDLVYFRVK